LLGPHESNRIAQRPALGRVQKAYGEKDLKERVPWYLKIPAKIALAHLPISYGFWQKVGLFRHGCMDSEEYAIGVFDSHVARAGLTGKLEGKRILEMGPGDSIATAIIAYAHGARATLIDVGPFATDDASGYLPLCEALRNSGLTPPNIRSEDSIATILEKCRAEYHTHGLASWSQLKSSSVNLIFSQAVLEHVRKREFLPIMGECRRALRPDGVCSHKVDLRDHLEGGLNHLRFSEGVWESSLFANSGLYVNRITYKSMLKCFEDAGFSVDSVELERWERLPISRSRLARQFRAIPNDELQISSFAVSLRPQPEFGMGSGAR
jgi:SAM-dependent methyltransferase